MQQFKDIKPVHLTLAIGALIYGPLPVAHALYDTASSVTATWKNDIKVLSRTRKCTANREKWKSMDAPVIKTPSEPAALKLRSSGEHIFVPVKIPAKAL